MRKIIKVLISILILFIVTVFLHTYAFALSLKYTLRPPLGKIDNNRINKIEFKIFLSLVKEPMSQGDAKQYLRDKIERDAYILILDKITMQFKVKLAKELVERFTLDSDSLYDVYEFKEGKQLSDYLQFTHVVVASLKESRSSRLADDSIMKPEQEADPTKEKSIQKMVQGFNSWAEKTKIKIGLGPSLEVIEGSRRFVDETIVEFDQRIAKIAEILKANSVPDDKIEAIVPRIQKVFDEVKKDPYERLHEFGFVTAKEIWKEIVPLLDDVCVYLLSTRPDRTQEIMELLLLEFRKLQMSSTATADEFIKRAQDVRKYSANGTEKFKLIHKLTKTELYSGTLMGREIFVITVDGHGKPVVSSEITQLFVEIDIASDPSKWIIFSEGGQSSLAGQPSEGLLIYKFANDNRIPLEDPIVMGGPEEPVLQDSLLRNKLISAENLFKYQIIYNYLTSLKHDFTPTYLIELLQKLVVKMSAKSDSQAFVHKTEQDISGVLMNLTQIPANDINKWHEIVLNESNRLTRQRILDKIASIEKEKILVVLGRNHLVAIDSSRPKHEKSEFFSAEDWASFAVHASATFRKISQTIARGGFKTKSRNDESNAEKDRRRFIDTTISKFDRNMLRIAEILKTNSIPDAKVEAFMSKLRIGIDELKEDRYERYQEYIYIRSKEIWQEAIPLFDNICAYLILTKPTAAPKIAESIVSELRSLLNYYSIEADEFIERALNMYKDENVFTNTGRDALSPRNEKSEMAFPRVVIGKRLADLLRELSENPSRKSQ